MNLRKKSKKNRRRSGRIKRKIIFVSTILLTIGAGIVVTMSVFFKIDAVYVIGDTRYETADIIKKSGINLGDNLFLCNTEKISTRLCENLPYLGSVNVDRKIPNEIILKVEESKACMELSYQGSYVLINKCQKVLERPDDLVPEVILLNGPTVKCAQVGQPICFDNPDDSLVMKQILNEIAGEEDKISEVNISDPSNLFVVFQNKIKVLLGTPDELNYKFKVAGKIISEKLSNDEEGVLDMSLVSENGRSYFRNKKIN